MNQQKICVLVDSGRDVPQTLWETYDMRVPPLKILYPEGEHQGQVDITAQQVYDRFPGEIPQSSLPEGETVEAALERAGADDYEKDVGRKSRYSAGWKWPRLSLLPGRSPWYPRSTAVPWRRRKP